MYTLCIATTYREYRSIVNQIPHYMEIASKMTQDIIKDFDISDQMATFLNDKLNEISTRLIAFISEIVPLIANIIMSLLSSIWNIVLGLIISVYLLLDKEQFYAMSKKMVSAIFTKKQQIEYLN